MHPSLQTFEDAYGSVLTEKWKKCWSQLGQDVDMEIIDQEILLALGTEDDPGLITLNPTVKINKGAYRGNYKTVRLRT